MGRATRKAFSRMGASHILSHSSGDFPGGLAVKNLLTNAGVSGSVPDL